MNKLITILGPTATGKTKIAASLAVEINGEIISADSRQVYRGMDIGTGKDLEEYVVGKKKVPYHLVDIVNPGSEYNVFEFQQDFLIAYDEVLKGGLNAILCGGSGLYLDSVLRAYEMSKVPENNKLRDELNKLTDRELVFHLNAYGKVHNTTDTTDRKRTLRAIEIIEFEKKHDAMHTKLKTIKSINFGIHFERYVLRKRITERLKARLSNGMVQEVEKLLSEGLKPEQLMFYGLEYKFVTEYVTGQISHDEMFIKLNTAIHQFAKRQMTWFRRMEKKGVKILWIDGNLTLKEKLSIILDILRD